MKASKISTASRIIIFLCGLALIAVLFTPMWRIELDAPQYPEGLTLLIHANKIAGDVDIINGLNHYIGMKTLHSKDFIEFTLLPGIILFFVAAFILTALFAKRKWMYVLLGMFIFFGVVAMIDFWRWEYDYGHNLDPNAAIIVPGMAYQPPLIGFKQLLNFGAYSIPDIGGWIFVGVGLALLMIVIMEWRKARHTHPAKVKTALPVFILPLIFLTSCSNSPKPIVLGKDQCHACKMTISDERFGAEIVTKKSRLYKFDDARCLLDFKKAGSIEDKDIAGIYLTNFSAPHQLIAAENALYLKSPQLHSPMNGNIAVFELADSLQKAEKIFKGYTLLWDEISK